MYSVEFNQRIYVCPIFQHLVAVLLRNAERVPLENKQGHSLKQEIALTLIQKSYDQSAAQIVKKLDRRFPHGTGHLDR